MSPRRSCHKGTQASPAASLENIFPGHPWCPQVPGWGGERWRGGCSFMENQVRTPLPWQAVNKGKGGRLGWAWAARKGGGPCAHIEQGSSSPEPVAAREPVLPPLGFLRLCLRLYGKRSSRAPAPSPARRSPAPTPGAGRGADSVRRWRRGGGGPAPSTRQDPAVPRAYAPPSPPLPRRSSDPGRGRNRHHALGSSAAPALTAGAPGSR